MRQFLRALKLKFGPLLIRQLIGRGQSQCPSIHSERVVVAGLFNTASGIGESARLCFEGLQSEGIEVEALNLSWIFDQTDLEYQCPQTDKLQNPETGGTLILHLNGPETLSALWHIGIRRWHRNWKIIGFWAWELPSPPWEWRSATRLLSEIWAPSAYVEAAVRPLTQRPIKIVAHATRPLDPDPAKPNSDLRCLVLADALSSFSRKNLSGSIRAYLEAFPAPSDTSLTIKYRNIESHPSIMEEISALTLGRTDIEIISKTLPLAEIQGLIRRSDVLISLHRAEGFGLTIAEAMSAGCIAMCTAWSGNMEFVTDETAALISYDLVPVEDSFGIYEKSEKAVWADPYIQEAASKLRDIKDNRESYSSMQTKAAAHIRTVLAPANYIAALSNDEVSISAD